MANYDLTYEGSRVQGILDTGNSLKDAGYIFRGEATPSTVPGTPTERVAYIGGPGTYTNFGSSITVGAGCICVFKYAGSAWSNQVINTGLDSAVNTLQSAITAINNNIGNGYVYAGVAIPSTSPVTGKVFYLAVQAGTYTNFDNAVVTAGLNVIKYNGSTWSVDQVIAIDAEPTQGSDNLVKSGGVLNSIIQNGPAFDLSAYNAQGGVLATYADLSAALTALNALPAAYKKGGMSFKFVLTSDNKYVQYRLMLSGSFTNAQFTNVNNWQGDVGVEMTSHLTYKAILDWKYGIIDLSNGNSYPSTVDLRTVSMHETRLFNRIEIADDYKIGVVYYNENKQYAGYKDYQTGGTLIISKVYPYFNLTLKNSNHSDIDISNGYESDVYCYVNTNEVNSQISTKYIDLNYPVKAGTIAVYNDEIYTCIKDISSFEPFDSAKWSKVNIGELLQRAFLTRYSLLTPSNLYSYGISDVTDIAKNTTVYIAGNITSTMITNLPIYGNVQIITRIDASLNDGRSLFFSLIVPSHQLYVNSTDYYGNLGTWERIDNKQLKEELSLLNTKFVGTLNMLPYSLEQGNILPNGVTFDDTNTKYIRFASNVYVGKNRNIQIITKDSDYQYRITFSDSATAGSNTEMPLSGFVKCAEFTTSKDYIRMSFRKVVDGNPVDITPQDVYENVSILYNENYQEAVKYVNPNGANGYMNPAGGVGFGDQYFGVVFSLPTIIGKRYRIVTTSTDYRVAIASKSLRLNFAIRAFEFIADANPTNILISPKDGQQLQPSTAKTAFSYYEINRKQHDCYDVIVAASDSTEEDKRKADIICDGVNDEVEINCAVNCNLFSSYSANVLLLPGNYYVGEFTEYLPPFLEASATPVGYGAIQTLHGVYDRYTWRYRGNISGIKGGNKELETAGAVIHVPTSVCQSLDSDIEYSVLTAVRGGTNPYGYLERKIFNAYANFNIQIDCYDKNIIAVDGVGSYAQEVDNCIIQTSLSSLTPFSWETVNNLPSNLIGIRTDIGESYGTNHITKRCLIKGFHEALAAEGEHLLIENCGFMWSEIGISICTRNTFGNVGHSSVFIDNTIERCGRLMLIGYEGLQYESVAEPMPLTITYIGGSQEMHWKDQNNNDCYTKPILEVVKNCCAGYIGMEMYGMEHSPYGKRICEDGSCNMMKIVNEHQKRMRTTTSPALPIAAQCQAGTEIWDAVNGKMLWATSQGWKDAAGNTVS